MDDRIIGYSLRVVKWFWSDLSSQIIATNVLLWILSEFFTYFCLFFLQVCVHNGDVHCTFSKLPAVCRQNSPLTAGESCVEKCSTLPHRCLCYWSTLLQWTMWVQTHLLLYVYSCLPVFLSSLSTHSGLDQPADPRCSSAPRLVLPGCSLLGHNGGKRSC